jgi:hypothetical protein
MTLPDKSLARKEIRQIITAINQSWLQGHPQRLERYFHPDMVIAAPGLKVVGRGRDACVQSYRDFIGRAVILDYHESDWSIDVWGDTSVASYRYQISYQMNGQEHRDTGHDLFVFIKQKGKWQAVWRTLISIDGNL